MANVEGFIDYLKPYAQAMETKYGIDWRVIVAQAAQETGWGEYPREYNLWGMRFDGPAGQDEGGYALFHDQWEAIESYIYNVKKHHITAWEVRDDWEKFIVEIQNTEPPNTGAWAEDPNYTQALYDIMTLNLSGEPSSIETGVPFPQQYTPITYDRETTIRDRKGAIDTETPYYIKLQHVNDDEHPTGATTLKVTPDSQVLLLREKLIRVQEEESASPENYSSLYNNEDAERYHIKVKKTVTKVEKAGSLQFQIDGVLLEHHNTGARSALAPKITNQVQLKDEQLVLTRTTERNEEVVTENIILADERIILEIIKNAKKDRIELSPGKILLKGNDNSYVRIEDDVIQAKNASESQVWMKLDEVVSTNKEGTHFYLRNNMAEMKNVSGAQVIVTESNAKVTAPGDIDIHAGGQINILAGGNVDIDGSHIYIG